jgi:hypothetical protein
MGNLSSWIKNHKLVLVLVVVIFVLLGRQFMQSIFGVSTLSSRVMPSPEFNASYDSSESFGSQAPNISMPGIGRQIAPVTKPDRLVITDTTISVVVKDVSSSIASIQAETSRLGGYMVNSFMGKPEESASGNITVRVPSDKRDVALEAFRKMGLRVVNESVVGNDVTDEYEDLDARLEVLNKTKAKFEEILDQANAIPDLLNVQQQLISLQSQIDSVTGRQLYLKQSANLSKITIYLSTDEFSLPYSPSQPWRPDVVFKTAVRSVVLSLRQIGTAIIWLSVYSIFWLPVVIVVWLWKRRNRKTI